ncbi:hypothetical protein FHS15_003774 [Paenibacillus castaneae]|uniref:glycoside hydrolase family 26 protein n=1 Tax=Paenibacillus castaneae TaxID=474957 RepID=UPI000C9AB211|nr:glycosyl hydrolase [Paenibacillus castaneae]NIK78628.1 hypothetical protein [Paenibacillus castaneae]
MDHQGKISSISLRKKLWMAILITISAALLMILRVENATLSRVVTSSLIQAKMLQYHLPIAEKGDWTVHFTPKQPSYKLAKLEPVNGVYLGAYVLQDDTISFSMKAFNERTGRTHASFFKYVGYGQPFPSKWVEQVKSVGAFPHIAWEPNEGLEQVKDDEYIRTFAEQAKQANIPIFLRFASEMNGTWTNYSGYSKQYKQTWRMVHDIFAVQAPNVAMVWTVLAMPVDTIERFYPGDEFVDWVGVNVYNVKYHNGSKRQKADYEDPLDLLNYVYNRFGAAKPIQLSEFGATHFNTTDGIKDNAFASTQISRLYSHLEKDYPRIKAVFYFDVNNITAANKARRVNDYSITSEPELLDAYRSATDSAHFLTGLFQQQGEEGLDVQQRFTYRGGVFQEGGILYIGTDFFSRVLKLEIKLSRDDNGNRVAHILSNDGRLNDMAPVAVIERKIWTGTKTRMDQNIYRNIRALPLQETLDRIGYGVDLQGNNIYIQE